MARERIFKVAPGRSIMVPARRNDDPNVASGSLVSGFVVKPGDFGMSLRECEIKVRDGFLVDVSEYRPDEVAENDVTTISNLNDPNDPEGAIDADKAPMTHSKDGFETSVTSVTKGNRLFDLNPDTLKGRSLSQLKQMITERQPDIDLSGFKSKNDAIDFLSQDFNASIEQAEEEAKVETSDESGINDNDTDDDVTS